MDNNTLADYIENRILPDLLNITKQVTFNSFLYSLRFGKLPSHAWVTLAGAIELAACKLGQNHSLAHDYCLEQALLKDKKA